VPVLFGLNGRAERSFEAGRGVVNNQLLKDLFQACMMHDVHQLGIAVRNVYQGGNRTSHDFEKVVAFFDTLYASNRLSRPLSGITIIGY